MKIKRGNLLTVILAMLCAALIALGVGFALSKNETISARADSTEMYDASEAGNINKTALKELAQSAGYSSYNELCTALQSGAKNATDFSGATVKFGGQTWYAVYLTGGTGRATLTLWIASSVANTMFSDGTYNNSVSTSIKSNDYTYSWIRSAINMGETTNNGNYYGSWNNAASACTPTVYNKSTRAPRAYCAPTAFTHFSDFVNGGAYASVVVPGPTGDNVWLPSTGEAAAGGTWGCIAGMWSESVWTRSPDTSSYYYALRLFASGLVGSQWNVGTNHAIRPAINISLPFSVDAPEDMEATYTGSVLTIADVAADKKKWYDASLMDLTYPTANPTDMVDVDTYEVMVELNSTAIAAGYMFGGDADTIKGETDTLRYIKFKINPQKLTVPKITNSPLTYDPANGSHFTVDSNFDAATMTGVGVTTGITWNSASNCFDATTAGTYSVKFQLLDTKNYEWDVSSSNKTADQSATVKVEPKKLTIPTITAPQEYSGSALQFVLADFNSGTYIKVDSATGTGSNTVTGAGGAPIADTTDTFEATNVGMYTVKLSLRDTTNYAWSDGTNTAKNVPFEITQKELISTAIASDKTNTIGGAEWGFGDTATITITDNRASGENINLLFYYDVAGGTSKANTLTGTFDGINTTTITMPTNIAVGNYTLTVELNGSTGDNANYKITQNNTLNFKVASGKLDPATYSWTYTKDGAAGGTNPNDGSLKVPFELKAGSSVDGVKYEMSIQIPATDASFVSVDTTKHTAGYQTRSGDSVNTFKTIVALKSTDPNSLFEVNGNMQSTCEVEFNWEIEKGTFDLTNVKWEYSLNGTSGWTEYDPSNPPQYNDGYDITIRVKGSTLPLGLTLDSLYEGLKESTVDNYTATIQASDFNYNTNNFYAPNTSLLNLNWEIAKKNLYKGFKNVAEPFTNATYSGNIILKQLDLDPTFAGYIDYVYYDLDNSGAIVTLQDIKDAVDLTSPHNYKVEAYIKPAYASNYTVDDNGSTPSDQFKTGSNNKLASVTIDGSDGTLPITAEYDGNTHFDSSLVKITGDDSMNVTDFTVKYYKGTLPVAANELPAGELPKDAGDYCIEVILGTQAESKYILVTDRLTVTIEAQGIAIPTLGTITFNGKEQKFEDYLSGASWTTYGPAGMNIIKVDGKISERNVGAGNYTTTLELTDTNYKWIYPSSVSPTKAIVKYSLAVDGVKVTGDDKIATYEWNINPLIVDTTNMWNKGKKGATLNLPQNIKDLIAGGTLEVGYRYYDNDGVFVETPELKGGRSFKVEAVFTGDDAERNVQFKRSDMDFGAVSKDIDYTVPQTGAAVFFGNLKEAMSKTWLGLPIWAWLLIALALIILLIVIIVVCVKRRKTKEEREEIKVRKEEERRMQQEKLEAERELARAKQEAEIEKIKAQAQAGMAGAGMATMAMAAQQPAQQQQPQPVQQPVQQVVDNTNNELIKEMREQMAEMRAENRAAREQLRSMQYQQAMPQPMYQPQPVQAAAPAAGSDLMTLMDLKVQMAEMKSAQALAELKTAQAIAEAKGANKQSDNDRQYSQNYPNYGGYPSVNMGYGMQSIPAPQAVMTPYGMLPAPQQVMTPYGVMPAYGYPPVAMLPQPAYAPVQPKKEEEEPVVTATSQTTPSMTMSQPPYCPPGAVMTTTTTIDTSKSMENKSTESSNNVKSVDLRRTAADSTDDITFDVDGFYDPLD